MGDSKQGRWVGLERAVAVATLPIILWHGCMMDAANRASRDSIELTREQMETDERHWTDSALAEERRRREELRPLLAVNSGDTVTIRFPSDVSITVHDPNEGMIEIINLGKGVAFDIEIEWEINGIAMQKDDPALSEKVVPRHLTERSVAKLNAVPWLRSDELFQGIKTNNLSGLIRMRSHTANNEDAISEQRFTVDWSEAQNIAVVRFGDLIVRPFDWTRQSIWSE